MYLYHEWKDHIEEDGMFGDNDNSTTWLINKSNSQEFFEAIHVDQFVKLEEINTIITNNSDGPSNDIKYETLVTYLSNFLLEEKKVKFSDLIHIASDCTVPVDRIMKFLHML